MKKVKDLKIATRLVLSFSLIIVMALVISIYSITSLQTIQNAQEKVFSNNSLAVRSLGNMNTTFAYQESRYLEFLLYDEGRPSMSKRLKI